MSTQNIIKNAWKLWFFCFFLFTFFIASAISNNQTSKATAGEYFFPWPGILPDNKFYKVKVLRNKIIERLIINPVKKVEFDLLMADKTIYASKLLMEKGQVALAKETALKGENYYSMLVQDYNRALQEYDTVPPVLDRRITQAASEHQKIFKQLEKSASGKDKETFQIVIKFSQINFDFIKELRNPKNKE